MICNTSVSHFYKKKSNNDTRGTFICYHLLSVKVIESMASATGFCPIFSRALTNEDFVAPPLLSTPSTLFNQLCKQVVKHSLESLLSLSMVFKVVSYSPRLRHKSRHVLTS